MANGRSCGSTEIALGLIRIPVKLYLAAAAEKVSFNLLTPDGHRVRQKWVDEETNQEVNFEDLMRGYAVGKDFVKFSKDELKQLAEDKTGIELVSLVARSRINLSPDYVEKCFFLAPDKSDKAFKLLLECLKDMDKIGIAKYYSPQGRDNLVAIEARGKTLYLHQLYFEPELRDTTISFARNSDPSEDEIRLGKQLLRTYAERAFNIGDYKDEYGTRVALAAKQKLAGQRIGDLKEQVAGVAADLADVLKASLEDKE